MAVMRDENDPWARSARLERENEELARGILELQRKLTISEQAHFLYRSEVDRRLSAAEKRTKYAEEKLSIAINQGEYWWKRASQEEARTKYAEDQLQSALNLGEMWYLREQRGKEQNERLVDEVEQREHLHFLPVVPFPAGEDPEAHWGLTELGRAALKARVILGLVGKGGLRQDYDLAAVCSRCGRTYREHMEPEGPECDGFLATPTTAWREDT